MARTSELNKSHTTCFENVEPPVFGSKLESHMLAAASGAVSALVSGSVFEGRCVSDGLQVAIKFVSKQETDQYLYSLHESKFVPVEVALMQMMSKPPICKSGLTILRDTS
ncbi:hypothetical protein SRHO_G00113500 [Serrasalmus rhombeus]